ncbi:MAG: hypothetical protein JWP51_1957 [Bradyrhizobium sp.]|nr:hypothetical protein [Bradyrhizobium sp.]
MEGDDDSKKSHHALAFQPELACSTGLFDPPIDPIRFPRLH